MSEQPARNRPKVGLSTASVYPESAAAAFEIAAKLGYDGLEIMVWTDPVSQDPEAIRRLSDYHGVPVLAIHSPCLVITQRVWSPDPWIKLERSRAAAELLGAGTVVIHPPFRWQRDYVRGFARGLERMAGETDIRFAVENMFPLRVRGREVSPYLPTWDVANVPVDAELGFGPRGRPLEAEDDLDELGPDDVGDEYWVSDAGSRTDEDGLPPDPGELLAYRHFTLDLSHASVSRSDAQLMLAAMGEGMTHLHVGDGTGLNKDEHLVPGRGTQPCAEVLQTLAHRDYDGNVIVEVNTRRAIGREHREEDLAEALAFCRAHLRPVL
ncbi:sugar phosphate isomerase/epimerase [Jatrophihabitans telluris]|uniref:Sugar phosphate isomerase/epimerase n=1 Tax=Jatrophihabitans telluris TaxID=2038343 RepID=A0ABY4R137_9ACTN|nr:TIM barrel protein [Jatrophihabitans telluris]UQX88860.1 sugar phosphate isomerase/epimerase [Jatrophihabitans telluris]